jgi:hypothetical protein
VSRLTRFLTVVRQTTSSISLSQDTMVAEANGRLLGFMSLAEEATSTLPISEPKRATGSHLAALAPIIVRYMHRSLSCSA